jgi:hypothetical protein
MTSLYKNYLDGCMNELEKIVEIISNEYNFDLAEAMEYIQNETPRLGFRIPKNTKRAEREQKKAERLAEIQLVKERKLVYKAAKLAEKERKIAAKLIEKEKKTAAKLVEKEKKRVASLLEKEKNKAAKLLKKTEAKRAKMIAQISDLNVEVQTDNLNLEELTLLFKTEKKIITNAKKLATKMDKVINQILKINPESKSEIEGLDLITLRQVLKNEIKAASRAKITPPVFDHIEDILEEQHYLESDDD